MNNEQHDYWTDLLSEAAFEAMDAGVSEEEFFEQAVVNWIEAEQSAEIDKRLEEEWNAKPEAERKAMLDGLGDTLKG